MYDDNTKHVYIIGSIINEKYIGYTHSKEEAIEYVSKRKGLSYVKIKASKFDVDSRYGEELVHSYGNLVVASDEEYMFQSFEQYQMDLIRHIEIFSVLLQYVRFAKHEEKIIEYLMDFLMEYALAKKHGTLDGSEEDFFDYNAVVQWFIKNIGG